MPRKRATRKARPKRRSPQIEGRKRKRKGKKKPAPSIIVDGPVLYEDRNGGAGESCYRIRFRDLDGNDKFIDVARSMLSRPSSVADILLSAHAKLPLNRDQQLECVRKALAARDVSKPTLRVTGKVGWHHDGPGISSFVLYGQTIGPAAGKLQFDMNELTNPALGMKSGSLEGWREGLREPCENSDHLIFAAGIAASGPLYDLLPSAEPAIYHFQGARKSEDDERIFQSSSGKTLSARVAQSIFGRCQQQDLFGFSTTMAALEEACFASNHLVLVLDEEGAAGEGGSGREIDPRALPYRIIAGRSKRRSQALGNNRSGGQSWRMPVITTSERVLDGGNSHRLEGEKVRMVAIPFPPTWAGGIFHRAQNGEERHRLAQLVEQTIAQNHGLVMSAYLERLVQHGPALEALLSLKLGSFAEDVGASNDSWERRLSSKFGIVACGAQLLARFGLAPWSEQRAWEAAVALYRASRATSISIPQVTARFLERLSGLLKDPRIFPTVEKGYAPTAEQRATLMGIRRTIGGLPTIAIPFSEFVKLVMPTAVADHVLAELDRRGLLLKAANGGLRRQVQITGLGSRQRYVCIILGQPQCQ